MHSGQNTPSTRSGKPLYTISMDLIYIIAGIFLSAIVISLALAHIHGIPGVVMGLISSYRAGQKPHRDLIDHIRKLHNRK